MPINGRLKTAMEAKISLSKIMAILTLIITGAAAMKVLGVTIETNTQKRVGTLEVEQVVIKNDVKELGEDVEDMKLSQARIHGKLDVILEEVRK